MMPSVIDFHESCMSAWTGEHLAEFQRVTESFEHAGIAVDCEFGLTDEGDPWFVICDASNGEVLIHFARIGCRYVVAVECLGYRLEGASLPKLPCDNWLPARFGPLPSAELPSSISGDVQ